MQIPISISARNSRESDEEQMQSYKGNWNTFKFLKASDQSDDYKIIITDNYLYDNYNLLVSWVMTKLFVTRHIDEGKPIHIQTATGDGDGGNDVGMIE